MEDPIVYTKTEKHWDYGLLQNLAAGVSGKYTEFTGNKAIPFKTLWVSRGNKKREKILKTPAEHKIIEIRFYSSDTENEAFRVGQKRIEGRIRDIYRVDEHTNSGFIIGVDNSREKNANVYAISLDRDYLESIGAKRIYFYDTTGTINTIKSTISVSVEDWLSSKTYINDNIVLEPDTSEEKLLDFNIGDYVEIEYATGIHYSETESFKIESIDTDKIRGKLASIIPITLQVIPIELGNSTGHVRPSDFQGAGASLKKKIEMTVYEYHLDVSQYHQANYFDIQSYLIKTITQIDAPNTYLYNLDKNFTDTTLRKLIRQQLGLADDEPLTSELLEQIETLDCSNKGITSLTGIGNCRKLVTLNCSHNNLTALDGLRNLDYLSHLDCSYNNIRGFNLVGRPYIYLEGNKRVESIMQRRFEYVDCRYNNISDTEQIAMGDNIVELVIDKNVMYTPQKTYVKNIFDQTIYKEICKQLGYPITYAYLNTTDCEEITSIVLDGYKLDDINKIKSLNGIEYLINLTELIVPNNSIKELNIQNNTKLTKVDISYNKLTYNNTILTGNRNSKVIDLTKLTKLEYFDCRYNYIEEESYILKPPKRTIYDDNNKEFLVDSITNFLFYPQIENITYEFICPIFRRVIRELLELEFDDMIVKSDLVNITELDISNKGITSIKGIEYFINLEQLNCSNNLIKDSNLIFSGEDDENIAGENNICSNLQWLECQNNKIEALRLYNLPKLQYVDCSNNQLIELEIINSIKLQQLKCYNNKLSVLHTDIGNNSEIKYENLLELDCSNNQLVSVDATMYPNILRLYCQNNKISYLELNQCIKLQYLNCSFNLLNILRVDNCINLLYLEATNNNLEELDVAMCTSLSSIDITYNYIADISHVTNSSISALTFYPQMINITNKFDNNLLSIIRNILNKKDDDQIWNYDCLIIKKLEINDKNISKLDGIEYLINLEELYCSNNKLKSIDLNNNTKLRFVHCNKNNIKSININNCTKLEYIDCSDNEISSIDLTALVLLNTLYVYNNKLTTLNLSYNTCLEDLKCENNKLKELDISNNNVLKYLDCNNNQLLALDVSCNIYLETICCQNNLIQNFDPRGRIRLVKLDCSNNLIQELCVKSCLVLEKLNCSHNVLTELYLGNRENLTYLDCSYNSMISMDKVYDRNNYLIGDNFVFNPQITDVTEEFTDPIFRAYVRELLGIIQDDPIMYSDCANINILDVSGRNITDLHGIEYFVNLEELDCHDNLLCSLDVSKNELLTKLYCSYNYMVTLDDIDRINTVLLDDNIHFTPQNLIITEEFTDPIFRAYVRELLGITQDDPIIDQQCLNITEVIVPHMDIQYLDGIEWLVNITKLDCSYNLLESLDVTKCTKLEYIDCSYNHIPELDIRKCKNMDILYCSHNNMNSKDDVHRNMNIEDNNEYELLYRFEFDDQNIIINDEFNDFLFKSKIISMNKFVHSDVITDYVVSRITVLDLNGKDVDEDYKYKNLLGINWFVNLEELDCSYNIIEQLDVTGCIKLKKLNCSHNWIYDEFLYIHNHTDKCNEDIGYMETCTCALEELDCSYNYLKSITVSHFKNLKYLNCSYNNTSLTTLNIIHCSNLVKLDCSHNKLISLDCSDNIKLRELYCNHNSISRIELDDCVELEELRCYNNQLTRLVIDKCISLMYLYCYYNRIVILDITNNEKITQLDCRNNQLTKLSIANSELLQYVYCQYNNLLDLNLAGCSNIEFLNCSYNTIRYITLITNMPDNLIEDDNFIYSPQNAY